MDYKPVFNKRAFIESQNKSINVNGNIKWKYKSSTSAKIGKAISSLNQTGEFQDVKKMILLK